MFQLLLPTHQSPKEIYISLTYILLKHRSNETKSINENNYGETTPSDRGNIYF